MITQPAPAAPLTIDHLPLELCSQEPIHAPGAIQPHGVLLVLQGPELTILQASANTGKYLGVSPLELLGQPLLALLSPADVALLTERAAPCRRESPIHLRVRGAQGGPDAPFEGTLHRCEELLLLELEPAAGSEVSVVDFYLQSRRAVVRLRGQRTLADVCQTGTEEIKRLVGFDRVMIYRFDRDGHGRVVAEAREPDMEPYQGLHYPASDIPPQARQLYTESWLRLIPDARYQPVPLQPRDNPLRGEPTDLRCASLRSVSPIHCEYLANMGVVASMSISIICDGKLWGLVACHHRTPRCIPPQMRAVCELLGQVLSLQVASCEQFEALETRMSRRAICARLAELMAMEEDFARGLTAYTPSLLDLCGASSAIIMHGGRYTVLGDPPFSPEDAAGGEHLTSLLQLLSSSLRDGLFVTDALPALHPPAMAYKELGAGLLAIGLPRPEQGVVLWFRKEVARTVQWAGDPRKQPGPDGRLRPRRSFTLWLEQVRGRALPFSESDIEAARALRDAIVAIVVRKVEDSLSLGAELARGGTEADTLALVASHDLLDPLRSIQRYGEFLMAGHGDRLDEEGRRKLQAMLRLIQRMGGKLDALQRYARAGRGELCLTEVDLNGVLGQVLELLSGQIEARDVDVRVPRPLPRVRCDRLRLRDVLFHLIHNAVQYGEGPGRWVEIGWRSPQDPGPPGEDGERIGSAEGERRCFYVRDNGAGVDARHRESIFRIFGRSPERGQQGTGHAHGAGLAICKRLIERHGGRIWVGSLPGPTGEDGGSTFWFTLGGA